jgi:hypothetical protein
MGSTGAIIGGGGLIAAATLLVNHRKIVPATNDAVFRLNHWSATRRDWGWLFGVANCRRLGLQG